KILRRLNKKYVVLHDLLLPTSLTPSKITQIDHIVISPYGIFVIETKNYKGIIIGNSNDDTWTQVTSNRRFLIPSPILQNRMHLEAVSQYIPVEYKNYMYSIITFSPRASIK